MTKSRKNTYLIIFISLAIAVTVPLLIRVVPLEPKTRVFSINAQKYGYSPSRIVVNKGDTVVLKPTSLDVTHGFLLDGYPVEFIIKQQGIAYLKYDWEDDEGKLHTDWDKVSEIEFVAGRSGKFTFRCMQTCGNLHPFMTGELIVRPNSLYHLFIGLSIWVVLSLLLLFRSNPEFPFAGFNRIDVFKLLPWIKRIIKLRSFQFLVILPNFIVFYLFILSSLWGSPVGNRNIAIIFVWIAWWFVLKTILIPLGGRIWCMICPLPAPAEWLSRKSITAVRYVQKPLRGLHHRFFGLQKDWPRRLDNIWIQNVLLGGFLGTYSMAAMTEVRAIDPEICKKHKEKSCYTGGPGGWACPWNQYVGKMSRNNYCGLCTECIKACPKDNVTVSIRPFGSDRSLRGYDEVFNVIIMMVLAIAFIITMLGPWAVIKDAANITESREIIPFLIYLSSLWTLALLVFPGLFAMTTKGANYLIGRQVSDRDMAFRLAYIFIPMGISFWIAFSLPPVMTNYSYILSVLSDPMGWGWDIFGTADYPFQPFYPEWIPLILGIILLTGMYLGLSRGYLGLKNLLPDLRLRAKAMIVPSLFVLLVVNLLLKLFMG
jgi:hypothetical protein